MGRDGTLPWHLPADLKAFRAHTIGKPVVMGRKTYESIGKPLPQRRNIVLTRNAIYAPEGVDIARSLEEVFTMTAGEPEIAIIGGAQIFNEFAPYADSAFVTEIDADIPGDVYYEPPQRPSTVTTIGRHAADERNTYAMTFLRYDYSNDEVTGGSANESKPSV